jgi:hypothetical protein
MSEQRLLEGEYEETTAFDPMLERISRLEDKVAEMRSTIQRDSVVLLLNVLHQAMRDIAAGKYGLDAPVNSPAGGDKWQAIKSRLAPRLRECVDLLLIQKHMKRTQIAAAMKMDYSNCTKNVIGALLRQGLLQDNNGELSLKEL